MKQTINHNSSPLDKILIWIKRKLGFIESRPGHGLEWIALLLYIGLVAFVMVFHEPWFDEAQAWLIAKDASFLELLFEIPHYEGHPPLWHLVLVPFAKMGLPFEWGIKIPNLLINSVAVALLLWKSPFYRPAKLALPFTFFLFYQYGVISRNYCLLFLAFVLCAILYEQKNEKPFLFCAALGFLCLSSLYGIAFAAGICVVWLWELWQGRNVVQFLKSFLFSRTMVALTLLFVFSLALVALLLPRPDTYAIMFYVKMRTAMETLLSFLYVILVAPADAVFFDSSILFDKTFGAVTPTSVLVGTLFLLAILTLARKHKVMLLYIIPYLLFSLIGTKYMSPHHVGVVTLFLLFVAWCGKNRYSGPVNIFSGIRNETWGGALQKTALPLIIVGFAISISWSVTSSMNDIVRNYGYGRDTVAFIQSHGLDSGDYSFATEWRHMFYGDAGKENRPLIESFSFPEYGTLELAYLDKNIFYNYNWGNQNKKYIDHKVDNSEESRKRLADFGMPDLYLGTPAFYSLWPDQSVQRKNYQFIARFDGNMIYKWGGGNYFITLSADETLLEEIGARAIPSKEIFYR